MSRPSRPAIPAKPSQLGRSVTTQTNSPPIAVLPPKPETPSLFRKLELLEREQESNMHTHQARWMIPYADLLTLLLGLFLVLFATAGKSHLSTSAKASSTATTPPHVSRAVKPPSPLHTSPSTAQLQQQLTSALKIQGVVLHQQERGLVISLKDTILFAPGKADLSPTAQKTLHQLSQQIHQALGHENRSIRVEGHTDNTPISTPKYPSNWELSTARATNIVRYLIATRQFQAGQLSAAGYGEFKPVEENSSIEGKQKNRRVDIVILNSNTAHQEEPPSHLGKTSTLPHSRPYRD